MVPRFVRNAAKRRTAHFEMKRFLFGGRLSSAGVTSALFILATAAAVEFDGSSYARNASLEANVNIFWTIDTDLEEIRVAVHAKAASGWAGFGVSEMGGMEGADIVFYEASVSQVDHLWFRCHQTIVVTCDRGLSAFRVFHPT